MTAVQHILSATPCRYIMTGHIIDIIDKTILFHSSMYIIYRTYSDWLPKSSQEGTLYGWTASYRMHQSCSKRETCIPCSMSVLKWYKYMYIGYDIYLDQLSSQENHTPNTYICNCLLVEYCETSIIEKANEVGSVLQQLLIWMHIVHTYMGG